MKKIYLTNDQLMNKFDDWLLDVDADELSRIAGEIFGGECYPVGETGFTFMTNGDYWDAFGDIK